MLGDPRTLILDEPVNGLDPEGVQWVRRLVRSLAEEGRTVFLSSHLMSEMAQTADQLLVIGRGRILAAGPVQQVIDSVSGAAVRVRSPQATVLAALVAADAPSSAVRRRVSSNSEASTPPASATSPAPTASPCTS